MDKEAALEALRHQLQLERDKALAHLKEQLESEASQLHHTLSEWGSELELARLELKRLESEVAKREQGLGSASTALDRLREELSAVREELISARTGKETSTKERDLLLVSIPQTLLLVENFRRWYKFCGSKVQGDAKHM